MSQLSLFTVLVLSLVAKVSQAKPPQTIVGGVEAAPGEFPYQASVRDRGVHFCGGAIISKRHIITAAHCLANLDPFHYLTVVTGSIHTCCGGDTHFPKAILYHSEFYTHEELSPNDIGVIVLVDPIKTSPYQKRINLPTAPTPSNVVATVTGWGAVALEQPNVDTLRKVEVKTIDAAECQNYFNMILDTHVICTFGGPGLGTCTGDSGGPLVANGELIGIVSWGIGCAVGHADMHTSVYYYLPWLKHLISRRVNDLPLPN